MLLWLTENSLPQLRNKLIGTELITENLFTSKKWEITLHRDSIAVKINHPKIQDFIFFLVLHYTNKRLNEKLHWLWLAGGWKESNFNYKIETTEPQMTL